MAVAPCL